MWYNVGCVCVYVCVVRRYKGSVGHGVSGCVCLWFMYMPSTCGSIDVHIHMETKDSDLHLMLLRSLLTDL